MSQNIIDKKILFGFCTLAFFWFACAKPMMPSGGGEDKWAPKVLLDESEPNYQTNFNKKEFEIKFDEFVVIQNAVKEILVSPPTAYQPLFEVRTNTLKVKFDEQEVFKKNATYQINFGDAIRDYNVGNVLKNYSFVFATGDKIDSLSVRGTVFDLLDGSPVKDMVVMLYDQLSDSIVYQEKPLYFAKTDSKGIFEINNIRQDTFKVFGLSDSNLNYLFDNPGEKIAYPDSNIILTDSIDISLNLFAYNEKTEQRVLAADGKTGGIIKCVLQNAGEDLDFSFTNDSINAQLCYREDSLFIYYEPIPAEPFYAISNGDSLKISPRKTNKINLSALDLRDGAKYHPNQEIEIGFNHCVQQLTDSLISIVDTSNVRLPFNCMVNENSNLSIKASFRDTTPYILTIRPNAIDAFGAMNTDTIFHRFETASASDYGNIFVICDSLNMDLQYIFTLKQQKNIIDERIVSTSKADTLSFTELSPGDYYIEVIEDNNEDGFWTPGSYIEKRKAEKRVTKDFEKLRKDWDLNVTFDINSLTADN